VAVLLASKRVRISGDEPTIALSPKFR
jgi:hypothetical protein